jgi:hypothetical protein
MAILSSMITAAGCYYSEVLAPQETENFDEETVFIFAGPGRRTPLPKQCAGIQFTGIQSKVRGLVFAKIGKAAWQAV